MKELVKTMLILAMVAFCLFGFILLHRQSDYFREFEAALLSLQWMLLTSLAVWCGMLLFLTFSLKDLPLIGLLLIAVVIYFVSNKETWRISDAITLLFGVALGRATRFVLCGGGRRESAPSERTGMSRNGLTSAVIFLIGFVVLLAFASWWHLDMTNNFYHGPRWMGLWNNPNHYGLLMGTGMTLAIGLLIQNLKSEKRKMAESADGQDWRRCFPFFFLRKSAKFARKNVFDVTLDTARGTRAVPALLLIVAGMMGVGLLFSFSRGAWIGTAVGLLYLTKAYGKFKWRSLKVFLLSAFSFLFLLFGVWFFRHTPRTAPWYFQRLDISRGSVQHRLAAWKAGFEIMRDYPFGVGWNMAVLTYQERYSPPAGGGAAIVTNDYLMLGTQLGIPALACLLAYVGLCFRNNHPYRSAVISTAGCSGISPPATTPGGTHGELADEASALRRACHAGVLVCLVAFWFDGGLFKLATGAVFWILLELGSHHTKFAPFRVRNLVTTNY